MRNIRLLIEYEGTHYAGWQSQKNGETIQEAICKAIEHVVREPVKIYGAGRTDAGVHALGQVANFKSSTTISTGQLLRAINFYLPQDITVKEVSEVPNAFHSQYDTSSKIYRYTLFNNRIRTSLNRNFCTFCGFQLEIKHMQTAASYLLGTHDFTSFTSKASCKKNRIRTIYKLDITRKENFIYFTIEADGFLYNMVRAIVGTLIEVGMGKKTAEDINTIVKAKNRSVAGPTAPAKGLCLLEVKYKNTFKDVSSSFNSLT